MEILRMPKALENRGITGWPKIMLVGKGEEVPPGVPFIRATKQDFVLTFRVLIPLLAKSHPEFDWPEVFYDVTGRNYKPVMLYTNRNPDSEGDGTAHEGGGPGTETTTLVEMASDMSSHIDLNVLMELKMIPVFMEDVAAAIKVNVTNNYAWTDGYNKKLGMCNGYLTEQSRKKSLVILDISSSIPSGLSAGMMTLIQTITDITHADLILTGGSSYFYTNEEVKAMDIHAERRRIPRSNEARMFNEILKTRDMGYEVVIVFGDSDHPQKFFSWENMSKSDAAQFGNLGIKKVYSFFIGKRDGYGKSYETVAGYGRWAVEACPDAEVIHNYKWAKVFNERWDG